MDAATKRAIISARLDKAHDDLAAARDNLARGYLRTAVNRAYYTIFHIASAALLWLDVERARHSGIESAFGEYFVLTGLVEREYGRIYSRIRDWREDQDYSDTARALTRSAVTQIVADAERFVARLELYLREAGAIA
jgi:uncharacterized protein (UPF0332 family)